MNKFTFQFEKGINPEHAETLVKQLGENTPPSKQVEITFIGCPYVTPGVGWRIGNSLRRFASAGLVTTHMPCFTDPEWYRSFTRSGLGDSIAAHSQKIDCDGQDCTARVVEYYKSNSTRAGQNSVYFGQIDKGFSIDPDREEIFREDFVKNLKNVNVSVYHFENDALLQLSKMCFEAVQNAFDHANKSPLKQCENIVSYFTMQYFSSVGPHSDATGYLKQYIKRVPYKLQRKGGAFLYFCINDDGVGIAARQHQNPAIYWQEYTIERDAVTKALLQNSSVKLKTNDSRVRGTPGEGFFHIAKGLRNLVAFAVIRTGRSYIVFDSTEDDSSFRLLDSPVGYLPGTALEIFVPIPDLKDYQQELFPQKN